MSTIERFIASVRMDEGTLITFCIGSLLAACIALTAQFVWVLGALKSAKRKAHKERVRVENKMAAMQSKVDAMWIDSEAVTRQRLKNMTDGHGLITDDELKARNEGRK